MPGHQRADWPPRLLPDTTLPQIILVMKLPGLPDKVDDPLPLRATPLPPGWAIPAFPPRIGQDVG